MSSPERPVKSEALEMKPKSPSKRAPKIEYNSGRATSDPEMIRELTRRLLDGCPPSLRTEMAEKYGISPKKLHTLWAGSLKPRILNAVYDKFPVSK